jgi:hypothetical protein
VCSALRVVAVKPSLRSRVGLGSHASSRGKLRMFCKCVLLLCILARTSAILVKISLWLMSSGVCEVEALIGESVSSVKSALMSSHSKEELLSNPSSGVEKSGLELLLCSSVVSIGVCVVVGCGCVSGCVSVSVSNVGLAPESGNKVASVLGIGGLMSMFDSRLCQCEVVIVLSVGEVPMCVVAESRTCVLGVAVNGVVVV